MIDPLVATIGVGFLCAVVAGPAVTYGVHLLPHSWRRTTQWLVVAGALVVAIAAELWPGTRPEIGFVYVLAALPGFLAYLAFRTITAAALVSLAPLYFAIGLMTRDWPTYAPALALDRAIPVQPGWALVYGSLYVFIVPLPLFVVRQAELFRRAMRAYLAVMLVSYAGFLLYPTVAPRPLAVPGDGFAAWSLRLTYSIDPPHGCFPSLHVAYSFVSALTCFRVHRGVGLGALLWATLTGVSTLFTKQHYVVDVIAGMLAAYAAYLIFLRGYPREAVADNDRHRAPVRALAVMAIFATIVAGFWIAHRLQLLD
jgi:membrane-associated phospholipid phosphatase